MSRLVLGRAARRQGTTALQGPRRPRGRSALPGSTASRTWGRISLMLPRIARQVTTVRRDLISARALGSATKGTIARVGPIRVQAVGRAMPGTTAHRDRPQARALGHAALCPVTTALRALRRPQGRSALPASTARRTWGRHSTTLLWSVPRGTSALPVRRVSVRMHVLLVSTVWRVMRWHRTARRGCTVRRIM